MSALARPMRTDRLGLVRQFGLYLVVGGLSFSVDLVLFIALYGFGVPWLPASVVSLIAATLVNYVLSYKLAFMRGRFSRPAEIARLFYVASLGLALNTVLVWLFITVGEVDPRIAKVLVVPLVLGWNFLARRQLVFKRAIPPGPDRVTAALLAQVLDLQRFARRATGPTRQVRPRSRSPGVKALVGGGAPDDLSSLNEP